MWHNGKLIENNWEMSPLDKVHRIIRLVLPERWEDTEQFLDLKHDGSIQLVLRDCSETAWEVHRAMVAYYLTVPFSSLTALGRSIGQLGEGDEVKIADETMLMMLADHVTDYLSFKAHLEEHGIPFAVAYERNIEPSPKKEEA